MSADAGLVDDVHAVLARYFCRSSTSALRLSMSVFLRALSISASTFGSPEPSPLPAASKPI